MARFRALMMNKNKLVILLTTFVASVGLLSACSQNAMGKNLVDIKGVDSITNQQFFDDFKKTTAGRSELQSMILTNLMEAHFGDKVSKAAVNKEFNRVKKAYKSESAFKAALKNSGRTETSYKANIRQNLVLLEALKKDGPVTATKLADTYKTYEPQIRYRALLYTNKADADKALAQVKVGKSFEEVAKSVQNANDKSNAAKNGYANGKELAPGDSYDIAQVFGASVAQAITKLNKGQTTDVIQVKGTYYIFQIISKTARDNSKKQLNAVRSHLYDEKLADQDEVFTVVRKELKKSKVTIHDSDLKDALASVLNANPATTSSSTGTTVQQVK